MNKVSHVGGGWARRTNIETSQPRGAGEIAGRRLSGTDAETPGRTYTRAAHRELGPGHTIVTLLCDRGSLYLGRLFNPTFLAGKGLSAG